MATLGEITRAVCELPDEQLESAVLSLVAGLSIAANAHALHSILIERGETFDGKVYNPMTTEAYEATSAAARTTLNHVAHVVAGVLA